MHERQLEGALRGPCLVLQRENVDTNRLAYFEVNDRVREEGVDAEYVG